MNDHKYDEQPVFGHVHDVPTRLHPVVQPTSLNQKPVVKAKIEPVPRIPQSDQYITNIDPVFVDHLSRHADKDIVVGTSAGKFSGKLSGVAIDHIQLNIAEGRAIHIRIAEIIYFEGHPLTYE